MKPLLIILALIVAVLLGYLGATYYINHLVVEPATGPLCPTWITDGSDARCHE